MLFEPLLNIENVMIIIIIKGLLLLPLLLLLLLIITNVNLDQFEITTKHIFYPTNMEKPVFELYTRLAAQITN